MPENRAVEPAISNPGEAVFLSGGPRSAFVEDRSMPHRGWRRLGCLAASCVLLVGCSSTPSQEYLVYDAVLRSSNWEMRPTAIPGCASLVLQEETIAFPGHIDAELYVRDEPEIPVEMLDELKRLMKTPGSVDWSVLPSDILTSISDADSRQLFRGRLKDGWKDFYSKHPESNGIVRVSPVAFGPKGKCAIVYCEWFYAPRGAEGFLALLRLSGNVWECATTLVLWAS